MRENLFFCDTTYQLFTAINLAQQLVNKKESVDLIIYHQFNSSRNYSERLRELNVFSKIYDIYPPTKYKKQDEILKLIFCKAYLKRCCDYQMKNYDNFYCATIDNNTTIACYVVSKAKHMILFDDGLGSYVGHIIRDNMSFRRMYLLRLAHPFTTFFSINKIMLYRPEVSISKIKTIYEKMKFEVNEQIETVFGYVENTIYKNKVVFLDQPFSNKTQKTEASFQKVTALMKKSFGSDYIVRLHPRLKESNINAENFDKINNLWELECVNQISDECIIITVFSTAAIQPVMISDATPVIVFLYRLFQEELGNSMISQLDEYLQKMNTHVNNTNIYVPASWDEVETIFSKLGGTYEN